jgi:hypothetical protein
MKLDIINCYAFVGCLLLRLGFSSLTAHQKLVVYAKLALGHT